jgi:hypothetical protein
MEPTRNGSMAASTEIREADRSRASGPPSSSEGRDSPNGSTDEEASE